MKKVFHFLRKLLLIGLYLFFVVTSVVLAVLLYTKTKELNDINSAYSETSLLLNNSTEESQVTIENLQTSFRELNSEVERLKGENAQLETELQRQIKNGYGTVKGSIFPLLVGDSTFSQYQLVCAQSTNNANLKYCVTVSAYASDYTLVLPSGSYNLMSNIVTGSNALDLQYTARYTEFVKCIKEKGESNCNKEELSGKVLVVKVESGQTVNNVDPTDWIKK